MRTPEEMLKMILDRAEQDDRIRAVTMEGSRANPNAAHDEFSDFDICYYVRDVRDFVCDHSWINCFGDILIVQQPDDCYKEPYDYESRGNYAYLMQFADGNRIDLHLVDLKDMSLEADNTEPRVVLLNKDGFKDLIPLESEAAFYIQKPHERDFFDTCNEFRWLASYITKGLCRDELCYAKYIYDVPQAAMFMKMLDWKVAVDNNFSVTTGAHGKYLKRFLTDAEMERLRGTFPNGDYGDIWDKLLKRYDWFAELGEYVAEKLGYKFDSYETKRVRDFVLERHKKYKGNT